MTPKPLAYGESLPLQPSAPWSRLVYDAQKSIEQSSASPAKPSKIALNSTSSSPEPTLISEQTRNMDACTLSATALAGGFGGASVVEWCGGVCCAQCADQERAIQLGFAVLQYGAWFEHAAVAAARSISAAERGVRVRVLLDDRDSWGATRIC